MQLTWSGVLISSRSYNIEQCADDCNQRDVVLLYCPDLVT